MAEEFIIAGWLDYGPNRDQVLEHFTVVAAASRDEPGCLGYTVCADPEHPGRIVVFERWDRRGRSRRALQDAAHRRVPRGDQPLPAVRAQPAPLLRRARRGVPVVAGRGELMSFLTRRAVSFDDTKVRIVELPKEGT